MAENTKRSGPMVAVCLAPTDLRPEVDPLTGTVRADPRRADLTPSDAAALEYGLRAAGRWDGWVLAVAAGPAEIDPVLAGALAVGAEVVRIEWGCPDVVPASVGGPLDVHPAQLAGEPAALAAALADAISGRGRPVLVLCGDRSGGPGVGAVPALLADRLGIGSALGVVRLELEGPGRLDVQRRLDGGWRERLRTDRPAVVSVEAAGVRLRRASLAATLAAGEAAVTVERPRPVTGAAGIRFSQIRPYRPRTRPVPPPEGDARQRILSLTGAMVSRQPARIVGPLSAAEAARELLSYLERHGYGPPPVSGEGPG